MKRDVLITGVQYYCKDLEEQRLLAKRLMDEKPEMMLVKSPTKEYGMTVCAVEVKDIMGLVSRFDVEQILEMMPTDVHVLDAKVNNVDPDGECFTVTVECDDDAICTSASKDTSAWDQWQWIGGPLMDDNHEQIRLQVNINVLISELRRKGGARIKNVVNNAELLMDLARWDVSDETQTKLGEIRQLIGMNADERIRRLSTPLNKMLSHIGGRKRRMEFEEDYRTQLATSAEAARMYDLWTMSHASEPMTCADLDIVMRRELKTIDDCLRTLPGGLYEKCEYFGELMHCLLYKHIPHKKLMMLLSALMLRDWLRSEVEELFPTDGNMVSEADDERAGNVVHEIVESKVDKPEKSVTGKNESEDNEAKGGLLERLALVFNEDSVQAKMFLCQIANMKPCQVTSLVNRLIKERKVDRELSHRYMWSVLHESGLYPCSESNWNQRIG